jgi:hypothetical protein
VFVDGSSQNRINNTKKLCCLLKLARPPRLVNFNLLFLTLFEDHKELICCPKYSHTHDSQEKINEKAKNSLFVKKERKFNYCSFHVFVVIHKLFAEKSIFSTIF